MFVIFRKWHCIAEGTYYNEPSDRKAIVLVDADEGDMIAVGTTNIPDIPCGDDEVFIKDYAENEGMAKSLKKAGIIEFIPVSHVNSGHVIIPKYKLTEKAMKHLFEKS